MRRVGVLFGIGEIGDGRDWGRGAAASKTSLT